MSCIYAIEVHSKQVARASMRLSLVGSEVDIVEELVFILASEVKQLPSWEILVVKV